MGIQYKTELITGFYNNHDILSENNLYEETHRNSAFKSLFKVDKEYFKNQAFSTVIAYDNGKPIAFLLFEHYNKADEGKFTFKGVKRKFLTIGNLMMYTLPQYRGKGLASDMCKQLEDALILFCELNYEVYRHKYILINAVDKAHFVAQRVFSKFVISHTGRNNSKNKQDLKSELQYHQPNLFLNQDKEKDIKL